MGGTSWSDKHYEDRRNLRALRGEATFAYTEKVASGKAPPKAHEALDPIKLKAGKREARDSADHPESVPVFVGLDVTGSMKDVPRMIQAKLPLLLGLLLRKGYLEHPAICVAGIGDAKYDHAPFQVGQFESGAEIDDDITRIWLEGGGGGNMHESYEIALHFLAHLVGADSWEKRNKKGYAFIICDEELASQLLLQEVQKVFGDSGGLETNMPIEDLLTKVLTRWELYCIIPKMTSHYNDPGYSKRWKALLGERVLMLDNPDGISELIASTIGVLEDNDLATVATDLADHGVSGDIVTSVSKALANVGTGGAVANRVTEGTGLATL